VDWDTVQAQIQTCRICADRKVPHLRVPDGPKRYPPFEPSNRVKIFFVSVAPPWGGAYFWDESKRDSVRHGLFDRIAQASGEHFDSVRAFRDAGYFLVPSVKCPSEKDDNDHNNPSACARDYCCAFLRYELTIARPERILALGKVPMDVLTRAFDLDDIPPQVDDFRSQTWWVRLGDYEAPLRGTYFPGSKRHQGFDKITEDIGTLLQLHPRSTP